MRAFKVLFLTAMIWLTGLAWWVGHPHVTQAGNAGIIPPTLRQTIQTQGNAGYLVFLTAQADLAQAQQIQDWQARGQAVYAALYQTAATSQSDLRNWLAQAKIRGDVVSFRPYYIVNAIYVTSNLAALEAIATRADIARIEPVTTLRVIPNQPAAAPATVEWGVAQIGADQVWADFNNRGEGVVVAELDTGVQYTHSALVNQYRGTDTGSHDYNWFDATGTFPSAPNDDNGHGTHGMGVIVGDDGGSNQVGVAPGARWIAAKGCNNFGACSNADLLAAGEWLLAPYPIGGDPGQGNPDMRPHVINSGWGGPGGNTWYQGMVQAWRAANIFPTFAVGGGGPGAGTIGSPADYAESFGTGATDMNDVLAPFSARGPSSLTDDIKPDAVAPGVNIRSTVLNNGYATYSGTSMATSFSAGCAALVYAAGPALDSYDVENLIQDTAVDLGDPGPDYDYGYGRIDCYAAVSQLNLPDCWLDVTPGYQNNILSLTYDLHTNVNATWRNFLIVQGNPYPLWNRTVPAGFTYQNTVSWGFPHVGWVVIVSALTTPTDGIICLDYGAVNTAQP